MFVRICMLPSGQRVRTRKQRGDVAGCPLAPGARLRLVGYRRVARAPRFRSLPNAGVNPDVWPWLHCKMETLLWN